MNELTVKDIREKIVNLPNRPPAMLAQDVAEIYGVKAKYVNRAVKRNQDRFPADFCFRLTKEEWANLRSQNVTLNEINYLPWAFTRFGANQLSTVLKSPIADARSVQIMRAFSAMEEAAQQAMPVRPEQVVLVVGDFTERDRPVAVSTPYGTAYVNTATWLLHFFANARPGGNESRKLMSAQLACNGFSKVMPPALQLNFKLKAALLKANPLWSDIMHCQRLGLTNRAIARICGCAPSTLRRQLKKMQQAGLFDDPLAAMRGSTMLITEEGAEVQP